MRNFLPIAILLLTGCAGSQFGGPEATNEVVVKLGVIESVTTIELDASSDTGATVGSVFGQVGGSSSGGGRGATVGSILGSVLGGTLGQQSGIATRPGLEIWVRLDEEGKSTYVMQPGKPDDFKVGEHVRVLYRNGEARVEPTVSTPVSPAKP